jgi:hypothetical protein
MTPDDAEPPTAEFVNVGGAAQVHILSAPSPRGLELRAACVSSTQIEPGSVPAPVQDNHVDAALPHTCREQHKPPIAGWAPAT